MMMKLVALCCLVAAASATKSASYVVSDHDDAWCHSHHLGAGATTCVMNNGCCFSDAVNDLFKDQSIYDQRQMEYGPCHSCTFHETGFCEAFGNPRNDDASNPTPWEDCVQLAGCTWDDDNTKCLSALPEKKIEEMTCETFATSAEAVQKLSTYEECIFDANTAEEVEKLDPLILKEDRKLTNLYIRSVKNDGCMDLYYYTPQCVEEDTSEYLASQYDSIDQYFCVDVNGHEIPDTRKAKPLDSMDVMINCDKERVKHVGFQCPNAMTLTTQGGVVSVNVNNDALDCTNHCNTDQDCTHLDDHWCCFNGCAYTCKKPVLPFSGCAAIPKNHAGQIVHEVGDKESRVAEGTHKEHKMQISVSCEAGWDVVPLDKPQSVTLDCNHGNWEICDNAEDKWDCSPDFSLPCEEQCDPFDIHSTSVSIIDDLKMRDRDFVIGGSDNHYSATRKITCVEGYGIVAGNEAAKRDGFEMLSCNAGKEWLNSELTERSIECSVCFDDMTWRDENGNNCDYYKSRVMECFDAENTLGTTEQEDKCRVACRSCLRAEKMYGNKERRSTIVSVPLNRRSNWLKIREKVLKSYIRKEEITTRISVTNLYPTSEVCQSGTGGKSYHATSFTDDDDTIWFTCEDGDSLMAPPAEEKTEDSGGDESESESAGTTAAPGTESDGEKAK